jgi:hypothetical protein
MYEAKPDEQKTLDSVVGSHPNFEEVANWEAGPNPPDFIGTRQNGERIGLELTEWAESKQSRFTKRVDDEYRWLETLETEKQAAPKSFDRVIVAFKKSEKFNRLHAPKFIKEFYALIKDADSRLDRPALPSEGLDFSAYPTLKRYLIGVFPYRTPDKYRAALGHRWVSTGGRFIPTDPQRATSTLLVTIQRKLSKKEYADLVDRMGLRELILLVHFGMKGMSRIGPTVATAPVTSLLDEVRSQLKDGAVPFSKIYLYIGFNEGPLHLIYP